VTTRLTACDRWGAVKVRWGIGRDRYLVPPGLYAVGAPGSESVVLVTANYKLTFDLLRSTLAGRDAWILVLDTKGINVWCAAGKGTFGTDELVRRVEAAGLAQVVTHRRLVLPQLGAPGVAAHLVKRRCGFKVVWGPVMMGDLPAFLDAGLRVAAGMRTKTFPLRERVALIPMELVGGWKPAAALLLALFLASGIGAPGGYLAGLSSSGITATTTVLVALAAGAVLVPLLLPWIPGRAFSFKGLQVGAVAAAAHLLLLRGVPAGLAPGLELAAWLFLAAGLASFLAMNFTGASTYTSLSGVRREMRVAIPMQAASVLLSITLLVWARLAA
jgi:acetyl-CoA decarbonylase/synthase complex subunit gamma